MCLSGKRRTDLEKELLVAGVDGIVRECDGHVQTATFKTIVNKDLLYSTGYCSMSCDSLDGRGV